MENKVFDESRRRIEGYVKEGRLRDGFAHALSLALNVKATAGTTGRVGRGGGVDVSAIEERLRQGEQNYRYMLDYAMKGAEDPGRDAMAADLGELILQATDMLERENRRPEDGRLYYSVARYEGLQPDSTPRAIIAHYQEAQGGENGGFDLLFNRMHSSRTRKELEEAEGIARRLFNVAWVKFPYSKDDTSALREVLTGGKLSAHVRELTLWGVMLGGLQFYDPARIELMLDVYLGGDGNMRMQMAALTALMLMLYASKGRRLSREVEVKLAAARERKEWGSDLRSVHMELVKPIDTDRITRKIIDEVVPEMMKLKPEIDKKLNLNIENFDPAEMEENPEWQEMLDKSGIADKLKEMSEIQEEGGDVMMGTFAGLKSFGFFHEAANWFLPFHSENSAFAGESGKEYHDIAEIIAAAPFLCDNDKYSFMLSLQQVPQVQRDLMMQQFKAQGDQLDALRAATLLTDTTDRRGIVNKHVQSLYRFFKLFRRKGEFRNLFTEGVNLVEVDALREDVLGLDLLPAVGEFYFKHGYYSQALGVFGVLAVESNPEVSLLEKMGFAEQKLGNADRAVEHYRRAEMLGDNSDWLLRRLARCLMQLHRPDEALPYLRELAKRYPDHAGTALNLGRCLVELGRYEEATAEYYKAEYLDEKSGKALRPLAWCLLMSGDSERSRKYYERVIERLEPEAEDYLNMGHLSLAEGKVKEAMNFYGLNVAMRGGKEGMEEFLHQMKEERRYLDRLGVDRTLVNLVVDGMLYNSDK